MPRRLPMFRAAAWVCVLFLVVGVLEVCWLGHVGVAMDRAEVRLGVLLPLALLAPAATLIFGWQILGHALSLRESMRKLASLDLEPVESDDEDLIGLRAAFDTMRAELDRAMRKLAHDDAQRRRLFADLAHELANPASALLGLGDTLARSGLPGEDGQPAFLLSDARREHLLRCLEGETSRVARLVEDIRDLAELDDPDVAFERAPADLAALVEQVVERFRGQEGARLELDATPVLARIDPERIDQVLTNLISNARRYSPADRPIRVRVAFTGGHAVITVEDRGPGVADADLARLGERLFRVDAARDRRRGGHGLGLSIVGAIVERHEGTLAFAHTASGGLTVTVALPLTTDDPSSAR